MPKGKTPVYCGTLIPGEVNTGMQEATAYSASSGFPEVSYRSDFVDSKYVSYRSDFVDSKYYEILAPCEALAHAPRNQTAFAPRRSRFAMFIQKLYIAYAYAKQILHLLNRGIHLLRLSRQQCLRIRQ